MYSKGSMCKGLVAIERLENGDSEWSRMLVQGGECQGQWKGWLGGARLGVSRAWEAIVRSLAFVCRHWGVLTFKDIFKRVHGMTRMMSLKDHFD